MRSISVQVPAALDRRVRIAAALRDMSRSEFIRAALVERLAHLPTISNDGAEAMSAEIQQVKIEEDDNGIKLARERAEPPDMPDSIETVAGVTVDTNENFNTEIYSHAEQRP